VYSQSDDASVKRIDALRRLDSRSAPPPKIFDVTSGHDLKVIFGNFEGYCVSKYSCARKEMVGSLN
jgi:hypothetical protein